MALITSAGTGLFNTGATWNGGVVPAAPNTAVVQNGHTVTIDANATLGAGAGGLDPNPETDCSFIVRAGGTLILPNTAAADYTWTLQGPFKIEAGGTFQVGDSFASPFPATRIFNIAFSLNWGYENWVAGNLNLYGCTAYHMASATSIRTRLNADAASGAGSTITVADPVDWQTNDYVMLGTGGDPAHAATICELIQITRVDATTFTANLADNHFGDANFGDVVIHATRNINIIGIFTVGFTIVTTTNGTTGSSNTVNLDINWCRFNYGGGASGASKNATISIYEDNVSGNRKFINDIKLRGNVFVNGANATAWQIHFYQSVIQQEDRTLFAENHAYNTPGVIFISQPYTGGHLLMGALSCISSTGIGINNTSESPFLLDIEDFTYVCDASWTSGTRVAAKSRPLNINRFKIHRCHTGLEVATVGNFHGASGGMVYTFSNGELFNSYGNGVNILGTTNYCPHMFFKNINLRNHYQAAIRIQSFPGRFYFINCLIDDASQAVGGPGAVCFGDGVVSPIGVHAVTWINCSWGSVVPNYRYNITPTNPQNARGRQIFQNCSWVTAQSGPTHTVWDFYIQEPHNELIPWDGSGDTTECGYYFGQNQGDYIHGGRVFHKIVNQEYSWTMRVQTPSGHSWEFIESEKPFSTTGVENQGLVCSGGEILKADTDLVDGTVNRHLRPFSPVFRQHLTKVHPIKLAVQQGEVISISVSLRKNILQDAYRLPKIHMYGCGINTSATMPNTIATWEKLTVSGTALFSDIVEFWISCFAQPNLAAYTGDPAIPYDINLYPRGRANNTDRYFWMHQPCNPGGFGYAYYLTARPACTPPSCMCYLAPFNCNAYAWDHFGPGCPFPLAGPTLNLELLVDGLEVDIT